MVDQWGDRSGGVQRNAHWPEERDCRGAGADGLLPDYDFKPVAETPLAAPAHAGEAEAGWGAPSAGKSLAGLVGAGLTLLAAGSLGLVLRGRG